MGSHLGVRMVTEDECDLTQAGVERRGITVTPACERKAWRCLWLVTLLLSASTALGEHQRIDVVALQGDDVGLPCTTRLPAGPALVALPPAKRHAFWDRDNLYLFGGVAAMRILDYTSTMNMLRRGREEILLPGDVVRNHAGFAALEAASTATSIGLSYILHRTGHHKLERWVSIGHIGVAGFGDVRNYALQTYHPRIMSAPPGSGAFDGYGLDHYVRVGAVLAVARKF